jgi:trk system potassium uptake protein
MYIIVAGAGNLGSFLIRLLDQENHDVVVIEKDEETAKKISDELDVVTIIGDATEPEILKKAGISQADIIVCLTSLDETNIVVGILSKGIGVKTVVISLSKIHYQKAVLDKLGIDLVIHPEAAAAGYIAQLITEPDILDLSFFSKGDAQIIEYTINKKSKYISKKLDVLKKDLPKEANIVGFFNNSKFNIKTDTTLQEGDRVLIVSKKEFVSKIKKLK